MAAKKKTAKKAATKSPAKKAAKKAASKSKAETSAPETVTSESQDAVGDKPAAKSAKVPSKSRNGSTPKLSSFVAKQRQRLLDLHDELVDAMNGVTGDIRNGPEGSEASGSGMHQGDAGSDAYDRDFALSVLAKEQDAIYEIEQALRRVDRGVYGICEMSGAKIPPARLEAIPFARLTVECQAQWEKDYGKQRFRPSAEIGFGNGHYHEDEDSESVSLDGDDD